MMSWMEAFAGRHYLVALVVLAVALLQGTARASCDDPFSDPSNVEDFHLRMSQADWDAMRESEREGSGCDSQFPYFEADFRCGDGDWQKIGVRRKKDRSQSNHKVPIKLDFNRVVQGQRWPASRGNLGFRKLTLNSGQPDDPASAGRGSESAEGVLSAMITEHLSWRLLRQELPEVGGVAYARITLHTTDDNRENFQGLYILIEDIDRTAIRSRYNETEGVLLKTTDPNCRDQEVFGDDPPNAATAAFEEWLDLDPEDFEGTWYERTNEAVALDGLLRQEALRELFVNTADTALGKLNNYYSFDPQVGKRIYFPWDLDDMFRPQPQIRDVETALLSSCQGDGGNCSPISLGVNTRSNDEIRRRYLETLCQLTNGVAQEDKVVAELLQIDQLIRPIIAEEVPAIWESRGQDPLDADTNGTYAAEVVRMQQWIPGRVQAVREMIESEGVACPEGCEEGRVTACDYWGQASQRTCTGGVWAPCEAVPGAAPEPPSVEVAGGEVPVEATGQDAPVVPMPVVPMPNVPVVPMPNVPGVPSAPVGEPPVAVQETGTATMAPASNGTSVTAPVSVPSASGEGASSGCSVSSVRAPAAWHWLLAALLIYSGRRRRQS